MILFPNAKINIGLNVLRKRHDNYHDLESLFFPLNLTDALEIVKSDSFSITVSGIAINSNEDNLVVKAYNLLKRDFNLSPVKIHLLKLIPIGAGLGGGSSDAAYTIIGLNELFELGLEREELIAYASKLGSDCPFFIINKPAFAEGKGEILSEEEINLEGYKIVLIKPECEVSTALAYAGINPSVPEISLKGLVKLPVEEWKGKVENKFEESVFKNFPQIGEIKETLYSSGAVYASMSGSGSSVFGLFREVPDYLKSTFNESFFWEDSPVKFKKNVIK